jgi:hypothetical protein
MTKFKGPLEVGYYGGSGTEGSPAVIEASGTATFAGPLTVGPSGSTGSALLVQSVTMNATNSAGAPITFNLPSGAEMVSYEVGVEIPFGHAGDANTAARVTVYLGSGTATAAAVIIEQAVSASGRYSLGVPGIGRWSLARNITSTVHANVSAKATGSAATLGQAICTISYIHNG